VSSVQPPNDERAPEATRREHLERGRHEHLVGDSSTADLRRVWCDGCDAHAREAAGDRALRRDAWRLLRSLLLAPPSDGAES